MRMLVVMLLAGCLDRGAGTGQPGDPTGPVSGSLCHQDTQCEGGDVCARNDGCVPPSEIRAVHVSWTVGGMPASATTCNGSPDLEIQFDASSPATNPRLGFAPVPCDEGKFSIDKLPIAFTLVELGRRGSDSQTATIDATTGDATIDLKL
jgi:hypothetical protein